MKCDSNSTDSENKPKRNPDSTNDECLEKNRMTELAFRSADGREKAKLVGTLPQRNVKGIVNYKNRTAHDEQNQYNTKSNQDWEQMAVIANTIPTQQACVIAPGH